MSNWMEIIATVAPAVTVVGGIGVIAFVFWWWVGRER